MELELEWAPYPEAGLEHRRFGICVVFTTWSGTAAALRTAAGLAKGWKTDVTVVAAQVVPWPADLNQPSIPIDINEERLTALADHCPAPTSVVVYLCRDRVQTLCSYVPLESIVVVGARKGAWRNPDRRLAVALRRAGYEVIVANER